MLGDSSQLSSVLLPLEKSWDKRKGNKQWRGNHTSVTACGFYYITQKIFSVREETWTYFRCWIHHAFKCFIDPFILTFKFFIEIMKSYFWLSYTHTFFIYCNLVCACSWARIYSWKSLVCHQRQGLWMVIIHFLTTSRIPKFISACQHTISSRQ